MEGQGGRPQPRGPASPQHLAATSQGIIQISLAKAEMLCSPQPLTSKEVLPIKPATLFAPFSRGLPPMHSTHPKA